MSDDREMAYGKARRVLAQRPVREILLALEAAERWEEERGRREREDAALDAAMEGKRASAEAQDAEVAAVRARREAEIEQALSTRRQEIERLDTALAAQKAEMETLRPQVDAERAQVDAERAEFRRLADLNATLRAAGERPQPEPPQA
ncbi:MAG: hypothetical protein A2X51_02145 [Candidatus Rokubacteria bacterium GWC2_70_24]|nr:MAG: hypothetical protein A2X51_02145 [Candidatus Rokubacteria bacterium GWC2_70_24]